MKTGRREFTAVAIIVGILLVLWLGGALREGFISGNPLPTISDIQSMNGQLKFPERTYTFSGNPTSGALTTINWFKQNVSFPTGFADGQKTESATLPFKGIQFVTQTSDNYQKLVEFIQQLPSGLTVEDNVTRVGTYINTLSGVHQQSQAAIQDVITQINKGPEPINGEANMYYWTYVYVFGTPSTNSVKPMGTKVPTPCHPSYKSIPGGSLEFKCFS